MRKARQDLDQREVDYDATMAAKLGIARDLFDQQGHTDLQVSPQLFVGAGDCADTRCPLLADALLWRLV